MALTRALNVTAAQAAAFRLQRQHLHGDRPAKAFALYRNGGHVPGDRSDLPVGGSAPAGRSAKALAERSVVDIVRDSAGVQAQVQSSAEIAIWTRRRETTREEIRGALWDTRDLVKTSAMRLTLHLIPARDLAVYINAMRPSSSAALARWQARVKISPAHVRMMIDTVLDSLSDGALTQQELIARAKQRAHKGMRAWLDHAWSAVRPAVIEGAIVYGPSRGAEATFVRVDKWLGTQPQLTVDEARAELLRRFLRAFGPATAHDFAKWSGIKVSDARVVVGALDRELAAVSVDGAPGWIASADVDALRGSEPHE